MKLKPALAAILSAAALLASSGSHAATFDIGTMPAIPNAPYTNNAPVTGSFFDRYTFLFPSGLTQAEANASFAASPGIQNMVVRLFTSAGVLVGTGNQSGNSVNLSTIGLTGGQSYYYDVTGLANGLGTSYTFSAQAVPEPGTYALFIAGLTAVGWVARRRRQA